MSVICIKKEFKNDYITRVAGEKLRNMIQKAFLNNEIVEIDFKDMIIASTSFFDEGFAKLALDGWNEKKFHRFIRLQNINKRDYDVLLKMCENRGMKI